MKYAYPYMQFSDSPPAVAVLRAFDLCGGVTVNRLEGVFLSDVDLLQRSSAQGNPLCRRDEIEKFEERYNGKFIPFPGVEPANKP